MPKWRVPRKDNGQIDFRPRRHHGFSFFIMICGFLLPPLAVAVRFGIGKDFFINCFFTLCAYIPGHAHNFFIQNIRNNEHRDRTPKWARRYGLVDDHEQNKLKKSRAWVSRYNDQNTRRRMYDDDGNVYTYERDHRFEDGDNPARPKARPTTNSQDGLDRYYQSNERTTSSADTHSVRRTQSRSSLRSFGRRSAPEHDAMPGAAEAELRRSKNKARMLPMLTGGGSRRPKADRHARSERVMNKDSDYVNANRAPFDEASLDNSLADGSSGYGRRDSFEGPEDADASIGRKYAEGGSRAYDAKILPSAPPQQSAPAVDIMNDNHQF